MSFLASIMNALRMPTSAPRVLEKDEAKAEIQVWRDKQAELRSYEADVKASITAANTRMMEFTESNEKLKVTMELCKAEYLKRQSRAAKLQTARTLVLVNRAITKNRSTNKELEDSMERAQSVVEQAATVGQIMMAEIKAAETYIALNGQLKLYGQALDAAAKIIDDKPDLVAEFEGNITGLMERIDNVEGESDWIKEADAIAATAQPVKKRK